MSATGVFSAVVMAVGAMSLVLSIRIVTMSIQSQGIITRDDVAIDQITQTAAATH